MGTRNLTIVIKDRQTKVAQYGQWDGYPRGQGSTALNFLRGVNLDDFKGRIDEMEWLTPEQSAAIEKDRNWDVRHPYLSRDAGADILNAIMYGKMTVSNIHTYGEDEVHVNVIGLLDRSEFAADSLFCEWCYVIDLDKNTFEVYEGVNKSPLNENERFYYLEEKSSGEYHPVKHIKTFSLFDLPTEEEFISVLEPAEEEDAD